MNLIVWLVIGGVVGWLASIIMKRDASQGIFLNIVVGVIGALLAGWFIPPWAASAPSFGLALARSWSSCWVRWGCAPCQPLPAAGPSWVGHPRTAGKRTALRRGLERGFEPRAPPMPLPPREDDGAHLRDHAAPPVPFPRPGHASARALEARRGSRGRRRAAPCHHPWSSRVLRNPEDDLRQSSLSQRELLNEDFLFRNADLTPSPTFPRRGSMAGRIRAGAADPEGRATRHTRTLTPHASFPTMAAQRTARLDALSRPAGRARAAPRALPQHVVCPFWRGLLGYAHPRGAAKPMAWWGAAAPSSRAAAPRRYALGRTCTHEVGHGSTDALGRRRVACIVSDAFADTPTRAAPTSASPPSPPCLPQRAHGDMFMNYMNVDDAAMVCLPRRPTHSATLAGPRASLLFAGVLRRDSSANALPRRPRGQSSCAASAP